MLRLHGTKHVINNKALEKMKTQRKLIVNVRRKQLRFLGHIMRKEGLETSTLTRHIEGKVQVIYLTSLSKWMVEKQGRGLAKAEMLLRSTRDGKLWRAMVAHV